MNFVQLLPCCFTRLVLSKQTGEHEQFYEFSFSAVYDAPLRNLLSSVCHSTIANVCAQITLLLLGIKIFRGKQFASEPRRVILAPAR